MADNAVVIEAASVVIEKEAVTPKPTSAVIMDAEEISGPQKVDIADIILIMSENEDNELPEKKLETEIIDKLTPQ